MFFSNRVYEFQSQILTTISHRPIRKNIYLGEILLDSSQYILSKYQFFRIFKNTQLKLFDYKICIKICKKVNGKNI